MIHIIVGNEAAKNLENAFALDENLLGEIVVLRDTLGIGEIESTPEISHDEIRTAFWQKIIPTFDKNVEDEKNVLSIIDKALEEEEPVCFWLSPCVSDVCTYYWLLQYFKPYPKMLHTINIIGLPFLNEKGQLFYPNNFSQIPAKEFLKTKRLLKEITLAEYEVEIDEWKKLMQENAEIRIYEGGKKIISKSENYFDSFIKNSVTNEPQKATKIVSETMKKMTQTVSNTFIEYRLRQLILQNYFDIQGNADGPLKEIELKKTDKVESVE